MTRRLVAALVIAAVVAFAGLGLWRSLTHEPQLTRQQQVQQIAQTLRCPTCQGESVAASRVSTADAMRQTIADQLAAGKSPEEIRAYFVRRYGEWVLYSPPRHGLNWLVWVFPAAAAAGGIGAAAWFARHQARRRRPYPEAEEASEPDTAAPEDRRPADDPGSDDEARSGRPRPSRALRVPTLAAVAVFLLLAGGLLAMNVGERGQGQEITGSTRAGSAQTPNASPTVDISQLRAATRQRPRDPDAWVALGKAHDARDELVAAYRAYRKASQLAPEARQPRLLLASTLLRGGSADEALPIAQRLVRQQPNDPQAVLLLGLAQREEDKPIARDTLRRYLQLQPDGRVADAVRALLKQRP